MYSTMELPPGRYCKILRKSREDVEAERRGRFETLAYHDMMLDECAARFGVSIAPEDTFKELESGESLASCPTTMEAIRLVAQGAYKGAFVREPSRLTRGTLSDQGLVVDAFRLSHTLMICAPGYVYDLSDRRDLRQVERDLFDGHHELGWIKERMMENKLARISEGQYLAVRAPFGWDKHVLPDRRKTVRPNRDIAYVLQWGEEVLAGRLTAYGACEDLNRRGVLSPLGKAWKPTVWRDVMSNLVHSGYVTWNSYKMVEEMTEGFGKRKRKVRCDKPLEFKGLHEGVMERAKQDAIICALKHGAPPRTKASLELRDPLAGLLRCSRCGHAMHRRCSKGRDSYTHYQPNRHECWMVGCSLDDVLDALLAALGGALEDMTLSCRAEESVDAAKGRLSQLEQELADSKNGLSNLMRLAEKGLITDEEFAARRRAIDAGMSEAQRQIAALTQEVANFMPREERMEKLSDAMMALRDYHGDASTVNQVLKAIIERIDYSKEEQRGRIHLEVLLR